MLREQLVNVLVTAVVVLALTNAFSVLVAAYTISVARSLTRPQSRAPGMPGWTGPLARVLRTSP
jgi:hypothetical protein